MRFGAIGCQAALRTTEQLSAVGQLLNSLELLAVAEKREDGGLNNWQLLREQHAKRPRAVRRLLDVLAGRRIVKGMHVGRVVSAAALLAPKTPPMYRAAAHAYLVTTSVAQAPRTRYGGDGADQMSFVVQASCLVARLFPGNERVTDAALRHIALQTTMAYTVSGTTKLAGATWRSGEALGHVLRTVSYGDRQVYALAVKYPVLVTAASHTVMALQCAFPLIFLRRGRLALPGVAIMGGFHIINGRVMGLPRFVWAFLSSYPAVLHTACRLQNPSKAAT
ncbi:hypothetical protein AB0J38_11375 [Streptomyces sp. NPDC050095]|uniref:hypothetical protein n=1 Tax=unclassified Streptomyces TaxID=2593676 RepID=UPI0034225C0C